MPSTAMQFLMRALPHSAGNLPHFAKMPVPAQAACPRHGHLTPAALPSRRMSARPQHDFALEPADTERLANLAGPFDGHLRQIELRLGVEIANRGNIFRVTGPDAAVARAEKLLRELYAESADEIFDGHAINLRLNDAAGDT